MGGGTGTGGDYISREKDDSKNWQQYLGQIVFVKRIPSDRILSGYVGRLKQKSGSAIITLSPYVNFYQGEDINLAKEDILFAEKNGIKKSGKDGYKAVNKSLKLKQNDIEKKISIERIVKN